MYALNIHSNRIIETKNPAKTSAGSFNNAEQCVNDSS